MRRASRVLLIAVIAAAMIGFAASPAAADHDIALAMPVDGVLTLTITGTIGVMPPAGRVTQQISVETRDPDFLDPDGSNNTDQAAVPLADMVTTKTASTTTPGSGDIVTFNITMNNS